MNQIEIRNPATNELIREIAVDDSSTILTKFEKAKIVQKLWRDSSMNERVECALRFRDALLANIDTLAADLTKETGKPISQARSEIKSVTSRIEYFAQNAPRILASEDFPAKSTGMQELVEHEPLGVIANISAWNYPYFVGLNVIVPALLAGNAVLYKPSEFAILSGLNMVRFLHESGFPKDLIAEIVGAREAGEILLSLPINGIFFTGSNATGQKILDRVGSKMMRVQLELGGQDGIYICEDAKLSHAVPSIAEGAFYNTGQGCCSVERIFVNEAIYERFREQFIDEVKNYKLGDPLDESTFIGPLTRPQHVQFLENQVEEITRLGGKTILGGKSSSGHGSFFEPTIIECAANSNATMAEESFGPIVLIQPVKNDAEAIQRLNQTRYGLTAGVYTPDKDRALKILKNVDVGTAYWNCCDRVSPYLPWSGRKASGVGVTLGADGIRAFVQSKAWHLRNES